MNTNWQLFPRSLSAPAHLLQVVDAFEAVASAIGTPTNQLWSNDVLATVSPHLTALGFEVEDPGPPKTTIDMPVLFGPGGRPEKTFQVDAFQPATNTIIEVEAGRGVANHQFLKDFFEACAIQDAEWLVIAVMNSYKPPSAKGKGADDWNKVVTFIDTLYESGRIDVPLSGVMILGY